MTDAGLTALVSIESGVGSHTGLAVLTDAGWEWQHRVLIPEQVPVDATLVGAGEWLVVLRPDGGPITIHVSTGAWASHDDGPLGGVTAAGAVWTGTEVLVWGGEPTDGPNQADAAPAGAAWTPPMVSPVMVSSDGGSCPPPADTGGRSGPVGVPIDVALTGGLADGYELGSLHSTTVDGSTFETPWTLVTALVFDSYGYPLGTAVWLSPDSIAAASIDEVDLEAPWLTPDLLQLYAVNELAVEITPYRDYRQTTGGDIESFVEVAEACLSGR
jgi:hypothetical protein